MWILILTLLNSNVAALTTAEFDTKEACEVAGQSWQKELKDWKRMVLGYYRCVSKTSLKSNQIYNQKYTNDN